MSDARSSQEIVTEMIHDIMAYNPRINYWAPLSVNRSFIEPIGKGMNYLEQLIYTMISQINPMTATGVHLDIAVRDRILDGRHPGQCASGQVYIGRYEVAAFDIRIPAGTQLVATIVTAGEEDVYVLFETTTDVVLASGQNLVYVDVVALMPGVSGNVAADLITNIIDAPDGIDYVTNGLDIIGGTDQETDADLLDRYINAPRVTGRATKNLIEEHIAALSPVSQAKIFTAGLPAGDIEIVVDVAGTDDNIDAVSECIRENIAGGISSRGILAATVEGASISVSLDECVGGRVWIRLKENIDSEINVAFTYLDQNQNQLTGHGLIPLGSRCGRWILCILQNEGLATEIVAVNYTGTKKFEFFIGLGDENYLFVQPTGVLVGGHIPVFFTETPESGLVDSIKASVESFLNAFAIGQELHFSDMHDAMTHDYVTGRKFEGIEYVGECFFAASNGYHVSKDGDRIEVERDEHIAAGNVDVENITT